jgi:hypothetical protein
VLNWILVLLDISLCEICIEISVGVSVALVLVCDILLFVTALRYLLVCL